jgi:hypothetical protein
MGQEVDEAGDKIGGAYKDGYTKCRATGWIKWIPAAPPFNVMRGRLNEGDL